MPTPSELHVDKLVTNYSRAYSNETYTADRLLPGTPVSKKSDLFARYDKDSFRALDDKDISTDTEIAPGIDYGVSKDSYTTVLYRLKDMIGSQEKSNADQPFNPVRDTTENLRELMLLQKEVRMAAAVLGTANYNSSNKVALANSTQWSNYGTATGVKGPLYKVYSAQETVLKAVLRRPNKMLVGHDVYRNLIRHPDVTESLKYVQKLTVADTSQVLAGLFGMDEFHVLVAVKNTALEGATDSLSFVTSDKAALIVQPMNTSLKQVVHTRQFQLAGMPSGDRWTERSRMGAEVVELRDEYTFKKVDDQAGFIFDDVIA